MSLRTPNLSQLLQTVVEHTLALLKVARPGEIQSVDLTKGVADVKPLVGELFEDEQGTVTPESLPILPSVPLVVLGGGGFGMTHPIAKGDQCLLIFADRSIDGWQANAAEKETGNLHRHHLADAIAIVGLNIGPKALTEWDAQRSVWGKQGGKKIALKAAEVHLGVDHGQDATEAAVLGTTYTADENSMLDNIAQRMTQIQLDLTSAQTALQSAATANSVPVYGGAAANPEFQLAASFVGQAATQAGQVVSDIQQFRSTDAKHKSTIVKVK